MINILKRALQQILDICLIALCSSLGYVLLFSPGGIRLFNQLNQLQAVESQKLSSTQGQIQALLTKTDLLRHDKQYQGQEARVVWELIQPGEQVVWYQQEGDIE